MQEPQLINKAVLLDTCFIVKAQQYSNEKYFDEMFAVLKENQCRPFVNNLILFEYARGCQSPDHLKSKRDFLNKLSSKIIYIPPGFLKIAVRISNIYANKGINNKQISLVDCFNTAFLSVYKNLVLVTLDINDYPLILHDRLKIVTIDTEKEILNLAFIKFNSSKYRNLSNDFDRARGNS